MVLIKKVGMNTVLLGIIIVLIGVSLTLYPLATVVVDTEPPTITYLRVDGMTLSKDWSSPTALSPNTAYILGVAAVEYTSGIDKATVRITGNNYDTGVLNFNEYYYINWETPKTETSLTFSVTVSDTAGNIASETFYGSTITEPPEGTFTINGKSITKDAVLYLNSRTLDIKFIPSNYAEKITDVKVTIHTKGLTDFKDIEMTKSGSVWEGTHTVEKDGQYILTGKIYAPGEYTLMSIVVDTRIAPLSLTISPYFVIGMGLIFIGLLITVSSTYKLRRR